MKTSKIISVFLIFLSFSFKGVLKPFSFLKNRTQIITKQIIILPDSIYTESVFIDTLNVLKIKELINLDFEKKRFEVEHIGTTPDYSIDFYDEKNRFCLLGIWIISKDKYAININHLENNKFYYGYVIEKEKFKKLINVRSRWDKNLK